MPIKRHTKDRHIEPIDLSYILCISKFWNLHEIKHNSPPKMPLKMFDFVQN